MRKRVFWDRLTARDRKHAMRRCADDFGHVALADEIKVDRSAVSKWANPNMQAEVPSLDACLSAADVTGDLWLLGKMNSALGLDERVAHLERQLALIDAVRSGDFDEDEDASAILSRADDAEDGA